MIQQSAISTGPIIPFATDRFLVRSVVSPILLNTKDTTIVIFNNLIPLNAQDSARSLSRIEHEIVLD